MTQLSPFGVAESLIADDLSARLIRQPGVGPLIASPVEIEIRGVGVWKIDERGAVSRATPTRDAVCCTITLGLETLEAVLSGQSTAHILYMRGKIKVRGDHRAALRFGALFA